MNGFLQRLACTLVGCPAPRATFVDDDVHKAVVFSDTRCPRCWRSYSHEEQELAVLQERIRVRADRRLVRIGDFELGGGAWGDHVSLWDAERFHEVDLNRDLVDVWGHHDTRPKVGQTLVGEFRRSFIKFRFESVDYCTDPPDMFFAKVKAIAQEMKP